MTKILLALILLTLWFGAGFITGLLKIILYIIIAILIICFLLKILIIDKADKVPSNKKQTEIKSNNTSPSKKQIQAKIQPSKIIVFIIPIIAILSILFVGLLIDIIS